MPCDNCPLNGASRPSKPERIGDFGPVDILFVSETPRPEADVILKEAVAKYLPGKKMMFTYTVCCPIAKNLKPRKEEIQSCRANLDECIKEAQPKIIVPVGSIALKAMFGLEGIQKFAGRETKFTEDLGYQVFPILHPAYLLHKPAARPQFMSQVKLLAEFAAGHKIETPTVYTLLQTDSDVESMLEFSLIGEDVVAFDYETNDRTRPWNGGKVMTAAFTWEEGKGYCFYFDSDRKKQAWLNWLKSSCPKIAHNAKFEYLWSMVHFGVEPKNIVGCTMLMHFVQDENSPHDLEYLKKMYTPLGRWEDAMADWLNTTDEEGNEHTYENAPQELLVNYTCEDVDGCLRLYNMFKEGMNEKQTKLHDEHQLPMALMLARVEINGLKFNKERSIEFSKELKVELDKMLIDIRSDPTVGMVENATGKQFNPNSPPQKAKLFGPGGLNLPTVKTTKAGAPSYGKDSLQHYERILKPETWKLVKLVSDYCKTLSAYNRFATEYPEAEMDGYLRTEYKPMCVTGRLSSSNPPLQNINKRDGCKSVFPSRFEGGSIVSVDFKQMELVILACLSRDDNMLGVFRRGEDSHAATAAIAYGVPPEEVTPEIRDRGKRINFASSFDISAWSLAYKFNITEDEAQELINRLKRERFMVFAWSASVKQELKANGEVTTAFGRTRHLPEARQDVNRKAQSHAFRQGVNSLIQSTATDLVCWCMMQLEKEYAKLAEPQPKLVANVHDNIATDSPAQHVAKVKALNKQVCCMLTQKVFPWLLIPLNIDISIGPTWEGPEEIEEDDAS